jgi:hypothetical protein
MFEPAQNHAMARGHNLPAAEMVFDPLEKDIHQSVNGGVGLDPLRSFDLRAGIVARMKARRSSDTLDLTLHDGLATVGSNKHPKLDAGRPGVEDEDYIRGLFACHPIVRFLFLPGHTEIPVWRVEKRGRW